MVRMDLVKKENVVLDKSYEFALNIIQLVKKFPQRNDGYVIGRQLLKAGTSIGANIEEALHGQSKKDFIAKQSISLKEAHETFYWLRLLRDSKEIKNEYLASVLSESEELIKIITAIIISTKRTIQN